MPEIPSATPELEQPPKDDARKFVTAAPFGNDFLRQRDNLKSYLMTTDYLRAGAEEQKIVRKVYEGGKADYLLIEKVRTASGTTVPAKETLTLEKYNELLKLSLHQYRMTKMRHEFDYDQSGIKLSMKYDEFAESLLCMLEVDADSEEDRNSFAYEKPGDFPYALTEVTGDERYYGYQVKAML